MRMAARSSGFAEASSSRISPSEGTASFRAGLFTGRALVPRKGLRSSECRRSIQVHSEEAAATCSRTVDGALPSAFSLSIQPSARAGLSSSGEIPCFAHQASRRARAEP